MEINLTNLMALGSAGVSSVEDIVGTVKAEIAKGGGAAAEAVKVVEDLIASEKFKADLVALVSAVKAIA